MDPFIGWPHPKENSETRRGSRISARGGRQGNDDLIWDGNERFLTYANTDLQLFKMFIAILCLNGVEQPFNRHQCPFFLPLRRGNQRLRRESFRPRGGRPPQRHPPPLDPRLETALRVPRCTPVPPPAMCPSTQCYFSTGLVKVLSAALLTKYGRGKIA